MTKKQRKVLIRIIIAAVLMIGFSFLPVTGVLQFILFMVPYLVIGYDILKKAIKGIWNRQVFDENFLMTVATIGAIVLGEYGEGVAVMLLYQVGELFQSYAVGKSRRNIAALMDIRPDYANVEQAGKLIQVSPNQVEVGSEIVVRPGEKLPLDFNKTEEFVANVQKITLDKCVSYNAGDDLQTQYGLGEKAARITINYAQDDLEKTVTLELGYALEEGTYIRLEGSKMVYMIDSRAANILRATQYTSLLPAQE